MPIQSAKTEDLPEALALLYCHQPSRVEVNIAGALQAIAQSALDPANILVATDECGIAGAVFCQRVAGSSAVVWPPCTRDGDTHVEDELLRAARLHAGDVALMQAFLAPEQMPAAAALNRAGFQHITRIWQMDRIATSTPKASDLRVMPYSDCDPAVARQVLLHSHDDGLDCPELQEVRAPDDLIAGYRDLAPDPNGWRLGWEGPVPVAVLILSSQEVCFVGVVPEHRRKGYGRAMVDFANSVCASLSLIVDARNEPAVRSYRAAGFEVVGAKEVFLNIFPR